MQVLPVISCLLISTALISHAQSSSDSNAKFAALSEEFIHTTLALTPSNASQAGYHLHKDPKTGKMIPLDALLDDVSAAGVGGAAAGLCGISRAVSGGDSGSGAWAGGCRGLAVD